jgi:LDH2 family malate/lactate/ureidoglycolate dehydrogenase
MSCVAAASAAVAWQADGPGSGLAGEIDELIAYAKASGEGVEIPNEQEQRYEAERLSAGVSLDAETWRQLTTCASQLGVGEEELAGLKQACIAGAGARAGAASKLLSYHY